MTKYDDAKIDLIVYVARWQMLVAHIAFNKII